MPLQWRQQFWQSLEEGTGKRCSECGTGPHRRCHTPSIAFRHLPPRNEDGCRKPVLGVWSGVEPVGPASGHQRRRVPTRPISPLPDSNEEPAPMNCDSKELSRKFRGCPEVLIRQRANILRNDDDDEVELHADILRTNSDQCRSTV